ncbi:MAG: (Fe-S)-binding protein [Pseudomonadota bacterium]
MPQNNKKPIVGIFVTCLIDLFRPQIAIATCQLLEQAGCRVIVPKTQSCCGQVNYNSGDFKGAAAITKPLLKAFEDVDYVVSPSGSCCAMIKHHLSELFSDETLKIQAQTLAKKTFELSSFLVDILHFSFTHTASKQHKKQYRYTYHDSCSGLRELGISQNPRLLLDQLGYLRRIEMKDSQTCCGFGGTFCVKYPDISNHIVSQKIKNASESQADLVLAGDLGCLLNMAGKANRLKCKQRFFHYAEILAGMADQAAILEP